MELTEKVAYLKGLLEGMELDATKKETKLLKAIIDVLDETALSVDGLVEDVSQIYDELDAIDEDLEDVEEALFEDDDDDCDCGCDCDCDDDDEEECGCGCGHDHHEHHHHHHHDEEDAEYEITCPNCDATVSVNEDMLFSEDLACPKCGAKFEVGFDEDEEATDEGKKE